jgi:hypothetical protein
MRYFIITPVAKAPNYLVFSKFRNDRNEVLTQSLIFNNKIKTNHLKCDVYLDGVVDKLLYNIDSIPIVNDELMRELKKCKLDNVIFYPVINEIIDNLYAMLVYNVYDCAHTIERYNEIPLMQLDETKIYSDIFRVKGYQMPLYVSENFLNIINKAGINNIDVNEI